MIPATDHIHPREEDLVHATLAPDRGHDRDRHHIQMITRMIIQMIEDHIDHALDQKDHTDREEHQHIRENQDTQDRDMI